MTASQPPPAERESLLTAERVRAILINSGRGQIVTGGDNTTLYGTFSVESLTNQLEAALRPKLAAAIAEARLEEARWHGHDSCCDVELDANNRMKGDTSTVAPCDCGYAERLAALEQARKP